MDVGWKNIKDLVVEVGQKNILKIDHSNCLTLCLLPGGAIYYNYYARIKPITLRV